MPDVMQHADLPHGTIRFMVEGPSDGPPILLIHPLGVSLEFWDGLAGALRDRFRVIRFDLRGHGPNGGPAGDYTIEDLGSDALAVLAAAGVSTAHVVGISIGGLVTMWMGVHARAQVRSLFIAQSAARVGTVERWEERRALVRERGVGAVAELAMGTWFTPEFVQSHPGEANRCRQMIAACPSAGYLGCCAVLRDTDLRSALPGITAPTLVLAGERDPSTPRADADLIVAAIPGARLKTLNSAHMSAIELADDFRNLVVDWVDSAT